MYNDVKFIGALLLRTQISMRSPSFVFVFICFTSHKYCDKCEDKVDRCKADTVADSLACLT